MKKNLAGPEYFKIHAYWSWSLTLKFTKWGPKKSEDGANGDRVLFKYYILFQVWHDVRLSAGDLCMVKQCPMQ